MKAVLEFTVETSYIQTGYEKLLALCSDHHWDKDKKKGVWRFPLCLIDTVEGILSNTVDFEPEDLEDIQKRTPTPREEVHMEEFKGRSGFEITHKHQAYHVVCWRKVEDDNGHISVQKQKHEIPEANVTTLRHVLGEIDETRFKDG